jgi:DNA-binding transcriptional ArsR family regulator
MFFVMKDLLYLERVEQAETLLKPQRIEVLRQLAEPRSCTEVAARLEQTQQRVYYHVKRLVEQDLVNQVAERRVRGINEGVYQAAARAYWLSPRLVGRIGQRQQRDEASLGYLLDLMEEVQSDVAALHARAARRVAQHLEEDQWAPRHPEEPTESSPRRAGEPGVDGPAVVGPSADGPSADGPGVDGLGGDELGADGLDLPSLGVSGEIRVRPDRRPAFMADLRAALQDLFTRYGGAEGDAFKLAVACYPDRPHDEDDRSRQGEDR